MNNVLQLKGTFNSRKRPRSVVVHNIPKNRKVTALQVRRIAAQLNEVKCRWEKDTLLGICLVSVHYNRIIPKSKRISGFFAFDGVKPSECIVGAKFEECSDSVSACEFNKRHVFTYNVAFVAIEKTIDMLNRCAGVIETMFGGEITCETLSAINKGELECGDIKKSVFASIVTDCDVIHHIEVDEYSREISGDCLISIYKTALSTKELLRRIGIDVPDGRMLDEYTVRLYSDEIKVLQVKAPYMIAMINDFSRYDFTEAIIENITEADTWIPEPHDEPYIGVIDTHFDTAVYFHDWVDYVNSMDPIIEIEKEDYFHGTAVSSIIVDGPRINPRLEDGCGRFRVKHFGVAKKKGTGSFDILKKIKEIVINNKDVKVWNLSLGSLLEISENFISAEASILDQLQCENDVVFVVAGTNDWSKSGKMRLGAPADSINSLVVNAVNSNNEPVSYSRKGPVLGFFYKPDISVFGGDNGDFMKVCGPYGEECVSGTSFAAPWVARKMAFLICKMGLDREVAKAMLIDAAAGWNRKDTTNYNIGYGIVPIHINDILKTREDEIKFVITGTVNEYETYNYTIPVPINNGMQPFWARATMVYFPYCSRSQGVDYTSTEVDLHFGRVFKDGEKVQIKEINNNKQSNEGIEKIYEKEARADYRKWDNVKYISEKINKKSRPKKVYEAGMWGLKIVTKERTSVKKGKGMRFGVVVTLREMNGVNRIDEFIKLCGMYGWLVTNLDIEANLNLYSKINTDVVWE